MSGFRRTLLRTLNVMRRMRGDAPLPRVEWLVVGLGNPGVEHARNRHNVGFWTVDRLASATGASWQRVGGSARAAFTDVDGTSLALIKPQAYVNRSGDAVAPLLRRFGLPPARMIVVVDDLELAPGTIRVRERGSHGGHNGMKSIMQALGGAQDFPRVRIGIGRPMHRGQPTYDPDHVAAYVLSNPPPDERESLDRACDEAAAAVRALVSEGAALAMNTFNRRED